MEYRLYQTHDAFNNMRIFEEGEKVVHRNGLLHTIKCIKMMRDDSKEEGVSPAVVTTDDTWFFCTECVLIVSPDFFHDNPQTEDSLAQTLSRGVCTKDPLEGPISECRKDA